MIFITDQYAQLIAGIDYCVANQSLLPRYRDSIKDTQPRQSIAIAGPEIMTHQLIQPADNQHRYTGLYHTR